MPSSQPDSQADVRPTSVQANESASAELSAVVDDLLNSLSTKFQGVSSEILAKMDEMSRRLDNLEAALQANSDNDNKGSLSKAL